jgi:hypothetical protein
MSLVITIKLFTSFLYIVDIKKDYNTKNNRFY